MKLVSRHAYVGSPFDHFYDVLVFEKRAALAVWRLCEGDSEASLSQENWNNRAIEYPVTGTVASGKVIGSKQPDAKYTLSSVSNIDLKTRIGAGEWVDRSNWLFLLDGEKPLPPINLNAETHRTKQRSPRYLEQNKLNCALQMIVPFASRALTDCSFSLCYNADHGFASNLVTWDEADLIEVTKNGYNFKWYPVFELTGPKTIKADGTAYLTLKLRTPDGETLPGESTEAYFETVSGYLPKTRVPISGEGEVKIKAMALGLEAGDEMRVKVGFRHYTGVSEHTLQVV